jgi:hypothetical protein
MMPAAPSSSRLRLIPIFLAQAIGLACGLVGIRLNSHLVPPAMLGLYGLFLTFTPIGMWLVYVGLLKYVTRHWSAATARRELRRTVLAVWWRRLPWLAMIAALPAIALTQSSPPERLALWLTLFVSAALLTLAALAQGALQADRAHWRDCATAATGSLTRSFIPPLLYASTGGIAALWAGFTLHALFTALAGTWALRRSFDSPAMPAPSVSTTWQIYEGPLFTVLALANLVILGLNRWLIAWFFGEKEAGYFTLAGGAAAIFTSMLVTALIQYLQPDLFALGDGPAKNRPALARRVDQVALFYSATGLAGVIFLSAIAPRLIGPLISPAYREAVKWIIPAGCFGLTVSLGLFYHTMLLAGRRLRQGGPDHRRHPARRLCRRRRGRPRLAGALAHSDASGFMARHPTAGPALFLQASRKPRARTGPVKNMRVTRPRSTAGACRQICAASRKALTAVDGVSSRAKARRAR